MSSFEIRNRSFLEEHESDFLSPFASLSIRAPALVERKRVVQEQPDSLRTDFQLDRDRILHSTSFRKLQYKTQVFATHEGDLYRTRMTHTIEVSQIARSIASILGLNTTLAEAIACAHDIGHPPFGHGGEQTLNELMQDEGGFDHNIQSLRMVDTLEKRYPDFRGLNLRWETREGLARHETPFDKPPGQQEFALYPQPSPECQAVNVADVIAWCTHDLDDVLRIGLITDRWLEARGSEVKLLQEVLRTMKTSVKDPAWDLDSYRRRVGRSRAISSTINTLIMDVVEATADRIRRHGITSLEEFRNADEKLLYFSSGVEEEVIGIAESMVEQVYTNPIVGRMTFNGERIIRDLFNTFRENNGLLPKSVRGELEHKPLNRVVCDFVAGMTEKYAVDMHDMLFKPGARTMDWF